MEHSILLVARVNAHESAAADGEYERGTVNAAQPEVLHDSNQLAFEVRPIAPHAVEIGDVREAIGDGLTFSESRK
jgi:hypothetical protein